MGFGGGEEEEGDSVGERVSLVGRGGEGGRMEVSEDEIGGGGGRGGRSGK